MDECPPSEPPRLTRAERQKAVEEDRAAYFRKSFAVTLFWLAAVPLNIFLIKVQAGWWKEQPGLVHQVGVFSALVAFAALIGIEQFIGRWSAPDSSYLKLWQKWLWSYLVVCAIFASIVICSAFVLIRILSTFAFWALPLSAIIVFGFGAFLALVPASILEVFQRGLRANRPK